MEGVFYIVAFFQSGKLTTEKRRRKVTL